VGLNEQWTERLPRLRGELVTLREIDASDVASLFTLFSNPAVTAFMAPPPPTPAKFAGFVAWSLEIRERGEGLCFGIVPNGMDAAVGILQVRSLDPETSSAEWGFVLGAEFWSSGVFADAANSLAEFAFTTMRMERLEARIAQRNARGHAAVRKLGAKYEATIPTGLANGIPRDPEVLWALREDDWHNRPRARRLAAADAMRQLREAVEAAQRVLHASESPETVEPYPLFLFDRRRREREQK